MKTVKCQIKVSMLSKSYGVRVYCIAIPLRHVRWLIYQKGQNLGAYIIED